MMFLQSSILFAVGAIIHTTWSLCPVDGPLLPRPRGLSYSSYLQEATQKLSNSIQSALNGSIESGWAISNTSFSLGLVSLDSTEPLWQYHHRGSANTNGSNIVDGDSQYLIGSISKLFSDLVFLRTGIDHNTPVTDYLPQLRHQNSKINWEDITIGSFADHLSGIPPNFGFSEYYYLLPLLEALGFPPLTSGDFPDCGVIGLNKGCSKDRRAPFFSSSLYCQLTLQELLQNILDLHPVSLPFERPVYSQLSFTILFYALEVATGKNYSQLLDEHLVKPFSLINTGVSPGNASQAVIPPVDNSWGSNYDDNVSGGGLYSSLRDLSALTYQILVHQILPTEAAVLKWLKPHSATSSPQTLVGSPWEIFRSTNLTPKYPHTIDIYSKSGGAYGYSSQLSVIDQYGIGIVILTAGDPAAMPILLDAILYETVGAVEDESRAQVVKYVGNWTAERRKSSSMELSMDNGPGLKLDRLETNGSSIIAGFEAFWPVALSQFGPLDPELRLYPANIRNEGILWRPNSSNIEVIREDWRITFSTLPNMAERTGSELPGQGAMKDFCTSWQLADWVYYGGEPIDRVVFVLDKGTEEVLGVEIPFLRIWLEL